MRMIPVSCGEWAQPPPCPVPAPGIIFSSTIPPSPVQGQLWWNGSALSMFDGAVWVNIGPAVGGAVRGVVDGSAAPPGYVGEFISGSYPFTYTGYPNTTTQNIPSLIIPAGDWNIGAALNMSTDFDGASIIVAPPIPSGLSSSMFTVAAVAYSTGAQATTLVTPAVRGSFSAATLLTFTVVVENTSTAGLPAGNGTLAVTGRRMR